MSTDSHPELFNAIESLREEISRLSARVTALESRGDSVNRPSASSATSGIDEETILVIAAAIAGFLGKKGSIRQIRLLGSEAWVQQGRVTIQASHVLVRHG